MSIKRILVTALLALCAASTALATDFPAPAYEWRLENVSPDVAAILTAVAPYWPEDTEQGSVDDHSGSSRCALVYWVGHTRGMFNWTNDLYGVEDCPQTGAARPVAEALLDSLGLSYIRQPVLAKTARRFETDRWLGAHGVVEDGRLVWLCDQLAKEPVPQTEIPLLASYTEMRDRWLEEQYTSPDDVILRYPVALGGLPLAEMTAHDPGNGVWQFICVIVTPEGKVIKVDLQNAQFTAKGQTEVCAPVTLEEAERIALEQYPYWMQTFGDAQDSSVFQESLRALSAYESIAYQPRLERGEAVYVRVGADRAVPAWSLSFRYDYVLDGEVVPVEEFPRYEYLFVSAVDGTLLIP